MAIVQGVPEKKKGWLRFATTDFCPWANRFVYWLKEPVGWFVLAAGISCAIGMYFSPLGWSLAAALVSLMGIGMIWPWVAVQCVRIELAPAADLQRVHEDADARMVVRVNNRLPLPLWGLAVEGYLDTPSDHIDPDDAPKMATVGLASVPPACRAEYSITIHPALRGLYPRETPTIACSFPFGIWTARKQLSGSSPLMVWPKVYPMSAAMKFRGDLKTETDEGDHAAPTGEFIGVRGYRRGDSLKNVNWIASARTDSLIVTERGAAQTAVVNLQLDTRLAVGGPDELSRRVRVAASMVTSLWHQKIPVRVYLGGRCLRTSQSHESYRKIMDLFAEIPVDGSPDPPPPIASHGTWIVVSGNALGTEVTVSCSSVQRRTAGTTQKWQASADDDLSTAMPRFWREAEHVKASA